MPDDLRERIAEMRRLRSEMAQIPSLRSGQEQIAVDAYLAFCANLAHALADALEQRDAEIARLRAALKPFALTYCREVAARAAYQRAGVADDFLPRLNGTDRANVWVDDLKAAADALKGEPR